MTDFPMTSLALYIDKIQVDKRVLHHVEVAARKNSFLDRIRANVFRAKDLKGLTAVRFRSYPTKSLFQTVQDRIPSHTFRESVLEKVVTLLEASWLLSLLLKVRQSSSGTSA
jgi:hypothetical protein